MLFFNPNKFREDFQILKKNIIYFDNSCVTLKPKQVVDSMNSYYNEYTACGGRSLHRFGKKVDEEVLKSRIKLKKFINAKHNEEIIFTRNSTEGINLIANSFNKGDLIIATDKEHNSNLVPWLNKGIKREIISTKKGFDLNDFETKLRKSPKLVSIVWTSNLDGTSNPVHEIIKLSHKYHVPVLLDAAQAVPHKEVDVRSLDVDYLVFSGHKMLGPSGTGILYGKKELLEKLPAFITGGETVVNTTYSSFEFDHLPEKFEAGLQNYSGIIGLGSAVDYLNKVGLKNIEKHESNLNKIITEGLKNEVNILGPQDYSKRSGIFSFNIPNKDIHETALLLDKMHNILVRSGMHCVHSWFNANNLKGSVRASLYLYNTEEEAKKFVDAVKKVKLFLK